MNLRAHNSARRRLLGASKMQSLLIVLIVLAALDLTRRFVTLYVHFSDNDKRPVVQIVEPASQSDLLNMTSVSLPVTNSVVVMAPPAATTPGQPTNPAPMAVAAAPPRATTDSTVNPRGKYELNDQVGPPMQKDYPLWSARVPVTFFSPWAVTLIATPDDDPDANETPTPQPQ